MLLTRGVSTSATGMMGWWDEPTLSKHPIYDILHREKPMATLTNRQRRLGKIAFLESFGEFYGSMDLDEQSKALLMTAASTGFRAGMEFAVKKGFVKRRRLFKREIG